MRILVGDRCSHGYWKQPSPWGGVSGHPTQQVNDTHITERKLEYYRSLFFSDPQCRADDVDGLCKHTHRNKLLPTDNVYRLYPCLWCRKQITGSFLGPEAVDSTTSPSLLSIITKRDRTYNETASREPVLRTTWGSLSVTNARR